MEGREGWTRRSDDGWLSMNGIIPARAAGASFVSLYLSCFLPLFTPCLLGFSGGGGVSVQGGIREEGGATDSGAQPLNGLGSSPAHCAAACVAAAPGFCIVHTRSFGEGVNTQIGSVLLLLR